MSRDVYADVGIATRAAIDRACACPDLTARDMRVLLALLAETSCWSWLAKTTTKTKIATIVYQREALNGTKRDRVAASLAKLHERDIISITDTGAGRAARIEVELKRPSQGGELVNDTAEESSPPNERKLPTYEPGSSPPKGGHSENVFSEDSNEQRVFSQNKETEPPPTALRKQLRLVGTRLDEAVG